MPKNSHALSDLYSALSESLNMLSHIFIRINISSTVDVMWPETPMRSQSLNQCSVKFSLEFL